MSTHELKTWPEYFQQVWTGTKTFEVRRNDRDFKVGDTLILKEYSPGSNIYTGRTIRCGVKSILRGSWELGVDPDFVIMSLTKPRNI